MRTKKAGLRERKQPATEQAGIKPLLTKKETAELYAVTPRTIDRWEVERILPEGAKVTIGGSVRFRSQVLLDHINAQRCAPDRAEPKHTHCDECGMEFSYTCCREIVCPGCNHRTDYGHECDCDQSRADDASEAAIQRIAKAVQLPVATVHAVLEMLTASTS